jgi:putative effector of murein hydrolase LrgA (UPF0299 family)
MLRSTTTSPSTVDNSQLSPVIVDVIGLLSVFLVFASQILSLKWVQIVKDKFLRFI